MTDAAPTTARHARNPAPVDAYRITMTIVDAPGPFASMRALAQYDVTNRECLAPPKHNPGGRSSPVPTEDIEIPLTPVGEGRYTAVVYADAMRDEDSNGHGLCHWELVQFRVHMTATGGEHETLYIPSIAGRKLVARQPETIYFNKRSYPALGESQFVNPGEGERGRFGPSIRDSDLFTVTFAPDRE